ncbi:MAG TPA: hypothetical protein VGM70_01505 [Pseudolysinimonas sp.]|jgi:hypothetical protein
MPRALLPWIAAFVIAVLAGAGSVVALNATVFGPGGFVGVYLDALARGDVSDALAMPGVGARGAREQLLQDGAAAGLRDIRQLSDVEHGGVHVITVGWTAPQGSGTTAFEVERVGTRLGLFPEWGFAVSPMATVALSVRSDARFTVNGVQEVSAARSDAAVDYAVLVPGDYSFGHRSEYLEAPPTTVVADTVGQKLSAVVQPRANAAFVSAVSARVHRQLLACTAQKVLFPTGCSFGQTIDNRVTGDPTWSMVRFPTVSVIPASAFGEWSIPSAPGTAHLRVGVTSLLDGAVTAFDQDVPFQLTATVTLGADDAITVTQE